LTYLTACRSSCIRTVSQEHARIAERVPPLISLAPNNHTMDITMSKGKGREDNEINYEKQHHDIVEKLRMEGSWDGEAVISGRCSVAMR